MKIKFKRDFGFEIDYNIEFESIAPIPRVGEIVNYRGIEYQVSNVIYNFIDISGGGVMPEDPITVILELR